MPQSTDLLSNSQGALLANNGFLNTWSATDHYALDDATADNGKHKIIQMPTQPALPTTALDPMFSSFTPAGNAGVLQYLSGPGAVVASPILPLQSSAAGINLGVNGTTNIFDFTSSIYCFGTINAMGNRSDGSVIGQVGSFYWNGSAGAVLQVGTVSLFFRFSGAILQIINIAGPPTNYTFSGVSWTLSFNRMFTPL